MSGPASQLPRRPALQTETRKLHAKASVTCSRPSLRVDLHLRCGHGQHTAPRRSSMAGTWILPGTRQAHLHLCWKEARTS